jgi:hypothetical protein
MVSAQTSERVEPTGTGTIVETLLFLHCYLLLPTNQVVVGFARSDVARRWREVGLPDWRTWPRFSLPRILICLVYVSLARNVVNRNITRATANMCFGSHLL